MWVFGLDFDFSVLGFFFFLKRLFLGFDFILDFEYHRSGVFGLDFDFFVLGFFYFYFLLYIYIYYFIKRLFWVLISF